MLGQMAVTNAGTIEASGESADDTTGCGDGGGGACGGYGGGGGSIDTSNAIVAPTAAFEQGYVYQDRLDPTALFY